MPPKSKSKAQSGTSDAPSTPLGTVLSLTFPDIATMARALARISAFIEDPEYENVPLSVDTIKDLDLPCKRYAGHNFPLQMFDQCVAKLSKMGPMTSIETVTIRAIQESSKQIKPRSIGYVIAHVEGDTGTFNHERQHAIYFFNQDYQQRVEGIWNSTQATYPAWSQQFSAHLGKMYCERVHVDEFQAIIGNREYECVQKLSQLVSSILPKEKDWGFTIVNVVLPKVLPPEDKEEEDEEEEDGSDAKDEQIYEAEDGLGE
jgi:hypothetical protein